jgi:predicted NAD/FAD-binding protein
MKRIAVLGSGISGLAAAYYLSRKHEVTLFEKDERLGGHTHTVMVDSTPVDTGFIVHNDRTYPNFVKLMAELGVETQPSDMSFAVTSPDTGFEYSSRGLGGFFAQRTNLLRPGHYGLLKEILRFNREAPKLLDDPRAADLTLARFLERGQYRDDFVDRYLIPMAGAVWSMSPSDMLGFPALTLVRFFQNHGMLGINTHPKWKTIRGGSSRYIDPITAPYRQRIELGARIESVARDEAGVVLRFADRPAMNFDEAVFACHGNQVLPLLKNPTPVEAEVMREFATSRNEVCLHTDERMLPRREQARASWNYLLGESGKVTMTYHMNRLQSIRAPREFCVTLNANGSVDPGRVVRRMVYHHPLYTKASIAAQSRWGEISGKDRVHFCGAYWFYGFHEDGVNSALRVARSLGVEC